MEKIICLHHAVSGQIQVYPQPQARSPTAQRTHRIFPGETHSGNFSLDVYRQGTVGYGEMRRTHWPSHDNYVPGKWTYEEECSCLHCLHKARPMSSTCILPPPPEPSPQSREDKS